MKDSKGCIQDVASQTNALESIKNTASSITTVSKQDLAEVTQLVRDLKNVVSRGGKRVFAALETEKHRDIEQLKKLEIENQQLRRDLFRETSELERLRSSTGSGPREVSMLRRIITKLVGAGTDLTCLSNRECLLAQHIFKKYEQRHLDIDKKMLRTSSELEDETDIVVTPLNTPRSPLTPKTPRSAKDIYSTPRWIRAEDVP